MSFETDKQKIRKLWEGSQEGLNAVGNAVVIQGKKQKEITFTISNNNQFNKLYNFNSDWMPLIEHTPENWGDRVKAIDFSVEMIVPEAWLPFAKLDLAYRCTGVNNVFKDTRFRIIKFLQVFNINNSENLKKAKWVVGFVHYDDNFFTPPNWYDYEMKLFFTMINPNYITTS